MIPGIVLYFDDLENLDQTDDEGNYILSDADFRQLVRGIKSYAITNEKPKGLSPAAQFAFGFIKPKIDREILKYETKRESGKKGGEANGSKTKQSEANESKAKQNEAKLSEPKQTEANGSEPKQTEQTEYEYEYENETVTEEGDEPEEEQDGDPPTLERVKAFVREKALTMDPEAFYLYYKARGWRLGGFPIYDWEALCESWSKREGKIIPLAPAKENGSGVHYSGEREYTEEEMNHYSNSILDEAINDAKKETERRQIAK